MKKLIILPLLLVLALLLSACFALEEPEAASGAVVAPTLAPAEPALDEAPAEEQAEQMPADMPTAEAAPVEPTTEAYPAGESAPVEEPPAAYPAEETPVVGEAASAGGGESAVSNPLVYTIDPARSEARFTINEVLRGTPTVVVGRTSNLGGQVALDLANPAGAQVGEIVINARDIATDNEFRNNAIANEILLTNDFEFITFTPTSVSGLPDAAAIGETYSLQITGDLTITDQTREVTFDSQVTPLSETELQGLAVLDILYADFGLTIPFARSVESVEDNVLLELDFIATAE